MGKVAAAEAIICSDDEAQPRKLMSAHLCGVGCKILPYARDSGHEKIM